MKRVVTGHKNGKSIFVSSAKPPRIITTTKDLPKMEIVEVWATDEIPTIPVIGDDPTIEMSSFVPGHNGTRFRITHFPPDREWMQALERGVDVLSRLQDLAAKTPGLAETQEAENIGMHTTETVDYGIVLSGEIWLELDDGAEVNLKPGDCVVQNGTRHAWRNRSAEPCVMAFIMIGAKRVL